MILDIDPLYAQKEFTLDEEYSLNRGGLLDLKTEGATVRIIASESNKISINARYRIETKGLKIGNKEPVRLKASTLGDSLVIREIEQEGRRVLLGGKSVQYNITIEAPEWLNLLLKGSDNSYFIRNMAGDTHIKGEKADVELQMNSANNYIFDLSDSSLDISGGQGFLKADFNNSIVRFNNVSFETIDMNLDDVDIQLALNMADDGQYNIDIDGGSLHFGIIEGGGTFKFWHNNLRIYSEGPFMVPINSKRETIYEKEGGNANVDINAKDSQLHLKVITDDGFGSEDVESNR